MQADDIARLLRARKCGKGRWRARCPVHRSKGLTLAIYAGVERTHITCHAGCSSDDVLATLGLTWKDTLYRDTRLSPDEKKEWAKRKYIADLYAREVRMQDLKFWLKALECRAKPVRTQSRFERDIELFCKRVIKSAG